LTDTELRELRAWLYSKIANPERYRGGDLDGVLCEPWKLTMATNALAILEDLYPETEAPTGRDASTSI